MAAPLNPMEKTYPPSPPGVSSKIFPIAGIKTTVYGLEELPSRVKSVVCLWLLHPRLSKQEWMEPLAAMAITEWNQRLQQRSSSYHYGSRGLIAVAFDQRNHGTRLIDERSNEAWRNGNPRHAQDMFSCMHGAALDASQLMTYLSAYAFPHNEHAISSHMILGVSLGAHAAWQVVLNDPRVMAGVFIIGCPDYVRLMSHRAGKSKLKTWTSTTPPGASFLGSQDFPKALLDAVSKYDPAGLFLGQMFPSGAFDKPREPLQREKERLYPMMRDRLRGKSVLVLSGGADKMVPYSCSEPFISWLKKASGPKGWFSDQGFSLKDIVYEGVGHEMTPQMARDALDFIMHAMDGKDRMTKL